jgi:hypothetical protein
MAIAEKAPDLRRAQSQGSRTPTLSQLAMNGNAPANSGRIPFPLDRTNL